MQTTTSHDFTRLISDMDALANALGVSDCTPELQLQIIGAWSDLLFKRLLLRIPEEHTHDVQTLISQRTAESDTLTLLSSLLAFLPDPQVTLAAEVEKAIKEFRLPRSA